MFPYSASIRLDQDERVDVVRLTGCGKSQRDREGDRSGKAGERRHKEEDDRRITCVVVESAHHIPVWPSLGQVRPSRHRVRLFLGVAWGKCNAGKIRPNTKVSPSEFGKGMH